MATTTLQSQNTPYRQIFFDWGNDGDETQFQSFPYAWEIHSGVACLVRQDESSPSSENSNKVNTSSPIQAALRIEDGLVEFWADASLPTKIVSAFLINLSKLQDVRQLHLSGHLSSTSVPDLCHLLEDRKSSSSLERLCIHQNVSLTTVDDARTPMDIFDAFCQWLPPKSRLASVDFGEKYQSYNEEGNEEEWEVEWILPGGFSICLVFDIFDC